MAPSTTSLPRLTSVIHKNGIRPTGKVIKQRPLALKPASKIATKPRQRRV